LLLLRGVGPEPDDAVVEVGMFSTLTRSKAPKYTPDETYGIDSRSVNEGTAIPKIRFENAYMTGNVIVAGGV